MSFKGSRQILLSVLVLVALVAGFGIGVAFHARTVSAQPQAPVVSSHHAQDIVDKYLGILNNGMKSGSCDFSALSTVYTSDATVTATGGPFSPGGPFGSGGTFRTRAWGPMEASSCWATGTRRWRCTTMSPDGTPIRT